MIFDFNIPVYIWILAGIAVLAAIVALKARFLPMLKIVRTADEQTEDYAHIINPEAEHPAKGPKVSVVVYAYTCEEKLTEYLSTLMSQDYHDFEVVVVNEGNNEVTAGLAERLTSLYPDKLYVTFIPPGSHNLSRRKLALTLGIKAAKGEVVLTTTSNCIIPSSSWLSLMMTPFAENSYTDIVLGVSHIDPSQFSGPAKWYREFDDTLTSMQWIGASLNGRTFRGDGHNLAYRRKLFFEQKGYSKTIHLMHGDDDLFIYDIADDINTEVMLVKESILTVDWGEAANRMHADLKERYQFTSTFLPSLPFLREGLGSSMQWLVTASAVAAALIPLPNLFPASMALVILLAFNITEIVVYEKAAHRLDASTPWVLLPLYMLWRPLGNLIFRLRHRPHRKKNFTFA
ncbi:MAG: glycosyltransferase [Muribaculaceae bacterium]|nr:glycosyltransferase [Muribaculaceae bacterium]